MGVSFKVSRKGTRFVPKPIPSDKPDEDDDGPDDAIPPPPPAPKSTTTRKLPVAPTKEEEPEIPESEVSFTLSLFAEGYTIGSPSENEVEHQSGLKNVPKFLHPYDRTSESFFSSIESGLLPGDILDDIPCKFVNGTVVCELQDYRKCVSQAGVNGPCVSNDPIVNRVRLRMSLENVMKDIPLIADSSWTYGDLMEVEARILKALQPELCLDPTPNLDRLCKSPVSSKLNLGLSNIRRKRLRQIPEVNETSINGKKTCMDRMPESSNSRLGSPASNMQQPVLDNMNAMRPKPFAQDVSVPASPMISQQQPKYQTVNPNRLQEHGAFNALSSVSGQDMMNSYSDNMSSGISSLHGKREIQEAQLNKRSRLTPGGIDGGQQQHIGIQNMDSFNGLDSQWKNALLQQQQQQQQQQHSLARGMQYANSSTSMQQKYPQQVYEGGFNNQESGSMTFNVGGQQYGLKEEPVDEIQNKNNMVETDINHMDPQQQQLLQSRLQQRGGSVPPQQFMRSNFPQTSWNSLGQNLERKEEQFSKRKVVQSPRVSAGGGLPQSPLSSKSGEFSSGSQFGGLSHKDKSGAVTSGANERQQQQQQMSVKRRTNSLPKTPAPMSGIASPASVSTMAGVSFNASSPSVGTPPLADQIVLERFSKIEMLAVRYRINAKKKNKKDDEHPTRVVYPDKQLKHLLSNDSIGEYIKDETCKMPLSKSLVGGNINVCKTRVLSFVQTERVLQGNGFSLVPKIRTRLIMSEKPNDGTVAMHYGEIEDNEYMAIEEHLPTLPSTHIADLLAAQFCSLMAKDGYHEEDHVQPKQVRPANSQGAEMQQQQNSDSVQPQTSSEANPRSSNNNNQHQINSVSQNNNIMSAGGGARVMLPPGNSQAAALQQHMSQASRSQQQNDPQQQPLTVQQQQQLLMQSQFQRSPLMLAGGAGANPLSQLNPNMQLGNQMMNKPTAAQLQMFQQQQQQMQQQSPQMQQQQQQQRKMMMGLGTVGGMGNNSNINNMVGLQGLGNVMGMGGAGARMGTMGVGQGGTMNLSQASTISNAISHQLRNGAITAQQAQFMSSKLSRLAQNRSTTILAGGGGAGGVGGQSTISGMPARQMHPGASAAASGANALSMLGSNLNRAANMNAMQQQQQQQQRTAMMGPPKLMSSMNPYMNQTQQQQQMQMQQQQQLQHQQQLQKQQQQQQQQQQQFQQQQQQQQQQPQQEASAMQSVVSSPQVVGSPSAMAMQQASPQQMSQQMSQQRTPMSPQLSTGAMPMHTMSSGGGQEACPASPQLSSQTIGSVAHSPMDLPPGNPAPPVNNTTPAANP